MKGPLEYLEEIQNKPESVRRAFSVASVLVIMAVIVSVWFANFSISTQENNVAIAAGSAEDQPTPFTLLWNYSKEMVSQIKDKFSESKTIITEFETEVSQLQLNEATSTESIATSTDLIATSTDVEE